MTSYTVHSELFTNPPTLSCPGRLCEGIGHLQKKQGHFLIPWIICLCLVLIVQGVEQELESVGENMKSLEKSAEKALEREEKLKDKILQLQNKFKAAEAR